MSGSSDTQLPFNENPKGVDYVQRLGEWAETLEGFKRLLAKMKNRKNFCLMGLFFVVDTKKYVSVSIYQNEGPGYSYRCAFYNEFWVESGTVVTVKVSFLNLVNHWLWFLDPNDFYLLYSPVEWESIARDEVKDDFPDMTRIDALYTSASKRDRGDE